MFIFYVIAAVLPVLFAAAVWFLRWSYRKAFHMPNAKKHVDPRKVFGKDPDPYYREEMLSLVDELEARPCERVQITSRDGLRLAARLYREEKSDVVEIIFHGWRGSALRDGCGGSRLAREAGHSILLVDQRAHGDSDGNTITFGIKERYDCLDWVNWTVSRFGKEVKILLVGVSMGAATVLMASALPLPSNVVGIVSDCAYSSPEAIIRKVCRDMGISDRVGFPFVRLSARVFGGFSVMDGGAVEAVRGARVPILLIHGTVDDFVPYSMCTEIYQAIASPKTLLSVPDAGHGVCFFRDRAAYADAVNRFLKEVL